MYIRRFRASQTRFGRSKGSVQHGLGVRSEIPSRLCSNGHHLGQVNVVVKVCSAQCSMQRCSSGYEGEEYLCCTCEVS